jgi:hypothetical protein
MEKHIKEAHRKKILKARKNAELQEVQAQRKLFDIESLSTNIYAGKIALNLFTKKQRKTIVRDAKVQQKELRIKIAELQVKKRDLQVRAEVYNEIIKDEESIPNEMDIIQAATEIVCTKNRVIETVKPIINRLKENGFNTNEIDIAQILKESGQFQKGYFSRKWKYKKQNIAFVKIKNNITIFWNFIRGFVYKIQK